jgi:hypothetical protein
MVKPLLNFSPVLITKPTSCPFTFFTSRSFTLSEMYLYQKDVQALPRNVQRQNIFLSTLKCSISDNRYVWMTGKYHRTINVNFSHADFLFLKLGEYFLLHTNACGNKMNFYPGKEVVCGTYL